jgi:beta-N-acetylhexosaminidase
MSEAERALFRALPPFGFILFQRNCQSPAQVRRLTAEMRSVTGRSDVPILIDQEGGRVARLKPPHWAAYPPAAAFGRLAAVDGTAAKNAARLNARLIADELASLGINVDCLPLLDLVFPGAHNIIGDRAYGGAADLVAALGRATCEGLMAGGVVPVIKHIPGHGRASVDSHVALPRVDAPLKALKAADFKPFADLNDMPVAMTAHVTYTAIDPENPATTSARVIGVIRRDIGFEGLLLSDDISMQALEGSLEARARASLTAGCDILLHCNGSLDERRRVLEAVPEMGAGEFKRLSRLMTPRSAEAGFDRAAAAAELERLFHHQNVSQYG